MVSYIAYLDMLGTQGFCGNPDVYFDKITTFYTELQQCAAELKNNGRVGFFSDCAYVESSDLGDMICFLTSFRRRLCSKNLFFNCALSKGELGIMDPRQKNSDSVLFGVVFENSQIAKVYVEQNRYKGIGVHIAPEVVADIRKDDSLKDIVVKSIFLPEVDGQPIEYTDLKMDLSYDGYAQYEQKVIKSILNACLLAYSNSRKHGRYYISILACVINSCDTRNIRWNIETHQFSKAPIVFNAILNLAKEDREIPRIWGIEYLCLLVVYRAYASGITIFEKKDIAKTVIQMKLFRDKYTNDLDRIPTFLNNANTRDEFISYYQDDLVTATATRLLDTE